MVAALVGGSTLIDSPAGFARGATHGPAGQPVAVPGPPTDLAATIRNQKVVLTWRAPRVDRKAGAPADYVVIWQAPPLEPLTADVDTHSTRTRYTSPFGPGTYEVEAKNAAGTGLPSKAVTVCSGRPTSSDQGCPPPS
jgi:hypothetical protein